MLYSSQSDAADESEVLHPEGSRLRKAARVWMFAVTLCASGWSISAVGQEHGGFGGVWSYGFSSSYGPNSSHILIGEADQRRVWTLGAEYTHVLRQGPRFRFDYEGSVMPLWEERDPTVIGTEFFVDGQAIVTPRSPVRVINITHQPVGNILAGNNSIVPLYALFGAENTYAAAVSPLGARVSALPHSRIQPSFALDLGFVVGSRAIPVDDATQFNYMFALGPGVQFFTSARTSLRMEYIYRHFSNAGQGAENPGVDQGVVRLTLSYHH